MNLQRLANRNSILSSLWRPCLTRPTRPIAIGIYLSAEATHSARRFNVAVLSMTETSVRLSSLAIRPVDFPRLSAWSLASSERALTLTDVFQKAQANAFRSV